MLYPPPPTITQYVSLKIPCYLPEDMIKMANLNTNLITLNDDREMMYSSYTPQCQSEIEINPNQFVALFKFGIFSHGYLNPINTMSYTQGRYWTLIFTKDFVK